MSIDSALSQHAANIRYTDLPPDALHSAKKKILWALGTTFAGAGCEGAHEVMALVRNFAAGSSGGCTIIGMNERAPIELAGFANGVFAKAAEYEDKLWMDNTHGYGMGASVVPAVFAAAEHVGGVDGKTLLAAVAVATDVPARMVMGAPNAIRSPFLSAYLFAHFGAAVAAARILALDEEKMANAIGLAYTQAAGNFQAHHEHKSAIRMQMGFGVRNGLYAAFMAKLGIDGPHQYLTGKSGLYPAFFQECDAEAVMAGLGSNFLGNRVGYKAYPCGAVVHPALDAVLQITRAHPFRPELVTSVVIEGSPNLAIMSSPIEQKQRPKNHIDQEFSLPWAIGCLLSEGRLSLGHFREAALKDHLKHALAQKVTVNMVAASNATSAEITLADGRKFASSSVGPPTGHHENPVSLEDFFANFRDCMNFGPHPVAPGHAQKAQDMVMRLEDVADVNEVLRLFA